MFDKCFPFLPPPPPPPDPKPKTKQARPSSTFLSKGNSFQLCQPCNLHIVVLKGQAAPPTPHTMENQACWEGRRHGARKGLAVREKQRGDSPS